MDKVKIIRNIGILIKLLEKNFEQHRYTVGMALMEIAEELIR